MFLREVDYPNSIHGRVHGRRVDPDEEKRRNNERLRRIIAPKKKSTKQMTESLKKYKSNDHLLEKWGLQKQIGKGVPETVKRPKEVYRLGAPLAHLIRPGTKDYNQKVAEAHKDHTILEQDRTADRKRRLQENLVNGKYKEMKQRAAEIRQSIARRNLKESPKICELNEALQDTSAKDKLKSSLETTGQKVKGNIKKSFNARDSSKLLSLDSLDKYLEYFKDVQGSVELDAGDKISSIQGMSGEGNQTILTNQGPIGKLGITNTSTVNEGWSGQSVSFKIPLLRNGSAKTPEPTDTPSTRKERTGIPRTGTLGSTGISESPTTTLSMSQVWTGKPDSFKIPLLSHGSATCTPSTKKGREEIPRGDAGMSGAINTSTTKQGWTKVGAKQRPRIPEAVRIPSANEDWLRKARASDLRKATQDQVELQKATNTNLSKETLQKPGAFKTISAKQGQDEKQREISTSLARERGPGKTGAATTPSTKTRWPGKAINTSSVKQRWSCKAEETNKNTSKDDIKHQWSRKSGPRDEILLMGGMQVSCVLNSSDFLPKHLQGNTAMSSITKSRRHTSDGYVEKMEVVQTLEIIPLTDENLHICPEVSSEEIYATFQQDHFVKINSNNKDNNSGRKRKREESQDSRTFAGCKPTKQCGQLKSILKNGRNQYHYHHLEEDVKKYSSPLNTPLKRKMADSDDDSDGEGARERFLKQFKKENQKQH